jgi:2-dehydro-3-deoxyphosphogluconate aldolase/(4S)-4-hydroxy-2-oxoglutarate aldolase
MSEARSLLARAPVVPVLSFSQVEDAVPIAEALLLGGLPVLEVTLRTPAGLPAIKAIRDALPEAIVGAGTVLNVDALEASIAAGSQFVVTPGLTPQLLEAGAESAVPFIPGVATVSEAMQARDAGLDCLKFFPAEANGGVPALKSLAGPLSDLMFCPTGGIGLHNLADYLSLGNVITVGGSWLTPTDRVAAKDWEAIRELAAQASHQALAMKGGES